MECVGGDGPNELSIIAMAMDSQVIAGEALVVADLLFGPWRSYSGKRPQIT
jgi:hypothetical protein